MRKQEIMDSHVKDWKASGLTQSKYCESVGINLATFSYWVVKFKNESGLESSSNLIAISKSLKTEVKQYEIFYPNNMKLCVETKKVS